VGSLPWWVTILIIAREIGVTILRFWVIEHGVITVSRGGKTKTLLQMIAISMFLVVWPLSAPESFLTMWDIAKIAMMSLAVILTVTTAIAYVRKALQLRKEIDVSNAGATP
jgi:CDP-diacylglycerol--glycerol-3-phosphate 3-phosphatidyltransferase